jgi:hypothetical protein
MSSCSVPVLFLSLSASVPHTHTLDGQEKNAQEKVVGASKTGFIHGSPASIKKMDIVFPVADSPE